MASFKPCHLFITSYFVVFMWMYSCACIHVEQMFPREQDLIGGVTHISCLTVLLAMTHAQLNHTVFCPCPQKRSRQLDHSK